MYFYQFFVYLRIGFCKHISCIVFIECLISFVTDYLSPIKKYVWMGWMDCQEFHLVFLPKLSSWKGILCFMLSIGIHRQQLGSSVFCTLLTNPIYSANLLYQQHNIQLSKNNLFWIFNLVFSEHIHIFHKYWDIIILLLVPKDISYILYFFNLNHYQYSMLIIENNLSYCRIINIPTVFLFCMFL